MAPSNLVNSPQTTSIPCTPTTSDTLTPLAPNTYVNNVKDSTPSPALVQSLPRRIDRAAKQSTLASFVIKMSFEEAEALRLLTKSEREEEEHGRCEMIRQREALAKLGKDERRKRKERERKADYRARKKAEKVSFASASIFDSF